MIIFMYVSSSVHFCITKQYRSSRGRMVVGFTTTYAINAYRH